MANSEAQDPRTGRPFGDHGTGVQAIEYALDPANDMASGDVVAFLGSWMHGDLDDWPEFYVWLAALPA